MTVFVVVSGVVWVVVVAVVVIVVVVAVVVGRQMVSAQHRTNPTELLPPPSDIQALDGDA